jgi:hypothetical protein
MVLRGFYSVKTLKSGLSKHHSGCFQGLFHLFRRDLQVGEQTDLSPAEGLDQHPIPGADLLGSMPSIEILYQISLDRSFILILYSYH